MTNVEFCHEQSALYSEACELYRLMKQLARAHAGWMDRDLRRHGRRLLEHAAATADAASTAMRTQALRYARLSALKLCATLQAANIDDQLPDEAYALLREQLSRVFAEFGAAQLPEAPSATQPPVESSHAPGSSDASEGCFLDAAEDVDRAESEMSLLATVPTIGTS